MSGKSSKFLEFIVRVAQEGPVKDPEKAMTDAGLSEDEKQALRSKDMNRIGQILSNAGISIGEQKVKSTDTHMPIPITLTFDTSWIGK